MFFVQCGVTVSVLWRLGTPGRTPFIMAAWLRNNKIQWTFVNSEAINIALLSCASHCGSGLRAGGRWLDFLRVPFLGYHQSFTWG